VRTLLKYEPRPIASEHVHLSAEILALTELLAKNAHEVWARRRMDEGWKYGPSRDDAKQTSPCLMPYEQLPESEKDYDRNAALETLKVILALGYRIEKIPPLGTQ
jgi:hypothetical protein